MSVAATAARTRAAVSSKAYRPSIQGLRAVAVVAVVLFHLAPNTFRGGYIGVDVFFVISGFLITAHIAREISTTGRLGVAAFWARRMRRLLPASLLVLGASTVMVILWLPRTEWAPTTRHVIASALYIENWALARDAVDYLATDAAPTVAQHYWSLSVEEQFYVIWPLILIAAWAAVRRRRSNANARVAMVWVLAVIAGASFVLSVAMTRTNPAAAYFVSQTRIWEFAVGGLAALVWTASVWPAWARSALAWVGLAAIAASVALFSASTAFPGWVAAVPVGGCVAVLAAGESKGTWSAARLLSRRPAVFLGDVSYSIYLWHWPLIVVWPAATGRSLRLPDAAVIAALTVGLAWVTKMAVEDPGRRSAWLTKRKSHTFAVAAVATLATVAVAAVPVASLRAHERQEAEVEASVAASPCYGPVIVDAGGACGPMSGTLPISPTAARVAAQATTPDYPGCQADFQDSSLATCELGADEKDAAATIAIVGDSHATQWFPALDVAGKSHGWRVLTFTKSACPLTLARTTFDREKDDGGMAECEKWRGEVISALTSRDDISAVVVAAFSSTYTYASAPDLPLASPAVDGYVAAWSTLLAAGVPVVAIADVPKTGGVSIPTCVDEHPADRDACAQPRATALSNQPLVDAARSVTDPAFHLVDLTHYMCDESLCHAVVGSMIVFRDASHLSSSFSVALHNALSAGIEPALARAPTS